MQRVFRTGAAARWWVGLVCVAVIGGGIGCGSSDSGAAAGDSSGTAFPVAPDGSLAPATQVNTPSTSAQSGTGDFGGVTGAGAGVAGPAGPGVPAGTEFAGTPVAPAPSEPSAAGGGDFCAVQAVMQAKCSMCHAAMTQFGAPMSLVTLEDFTKPSVLDPSRTVGAAVKARVHDTQRPMPPPPGMMTPEELSTIDAWVDAGMPAPAGECAPPGAPAEGATGPSSEDQPFPECDDIFELRASGDSGQPHVIRGNSEIHPKIPMDAPWGEKDAWVIGWHPINDNTKVLHHWILYQGGGFGGKFLIGWAYGQGGANTPEDVGIYVPKGQNSLTLDFHYYNLANSADEMDDSGLEVCVTYTEPKYVATTLGLGVLPSIPANQRVDNTSECTVSTTGSEPVKLMTVAPHMHKLGVNGKLELIRNGQTTVIHDGPFMFGDQKLYPIDVELMNGDVLRTTCSFENDTPAPVGFSNDSDGEMCFNFVEYYPMGALSCRGGFNI